MTRFSNRIDRRFAELASRGRKGLIPYVTAGHPRPELTVGIMHDLVAGGADLLELGIPFSDVMADGPVIQHACEAALEQGMTLDKVFAQVDEFRRRDADTPVILMGYMNPVERRGLETFAEQAAEAGVDGLLIVDCPADEAADTTRVFDGRELHQIFLVAPTTTQARIERMAPLAGGFIYYVSLKGVTGSAALNADELAPAVDSIRARSDLPVAVGFGISTPDQARAVGAVADAVVIGSALVRKLDGAESREAAGEIIADYIGSIRAALDRIDESAPVEARA
ncbi:MAG TPA: tryptophan synthase subunit alpha [Wenzhouxiangellaceae bacterium]|nr:tryptophan synthase subunit alpha [Wenzhouxiangellaceae bacterium]